MAFPTQAEAEVRLAQLRDAREALDRQIADCLAFLELGRRLRAPEPPASSPDKVDASANPNESEIDAFPGTRQRGRAMIAACVAILREAGRPLHAGELLERLLASGFTIAGTDPVASLNTRLWKRSESRGPFRRLGDAVYDLADVGSTSSRDGAMGDQKP